MASKKPSSFSSQYKGKIISRKRSWIALMWLVLLAAIVGIIVGLLLPHLNNNVAQVTGSYEAYGSAADALKLLQVQSPHTAGYDRKVFGYRTTDDDGNGCDVRDDVLARDLKNVRFTYVGSCTVKSGILHDPYTGLQINFKRGRKTSSLVQIDHVVALENAWQSGAWKWSVKKRLSFGNDMLNLLAVQGSANEKKGSASAAYWLPSNKSFRCSYVARQIAVKRKYNLSVTSAEKQEMLSVLQGCSAQELPKR